MYTPFWFGFNSQNGPYAHFGYLTLISDPWPNKCITLVSSFVKRMDRVLVKNWLTELAINRFDFLKGLLCIFGIKYIYQIDFVGICMYSKGSENICVVVQYFWCKPICKSSQKARKVQAPLLRFGHNTSYRQIIPYIGIFCVGQF